MPYARKDLLTWQKGMYYHIYTHHGHKLRLFPLREAQFVTEGII